MVAAGTKEAALIVEKGKKESNLMVASGKAALEQAARDLILSLQKTIEGHFDRLLEESVNNSFSSDQLVALISDVVKANIAPTKESVVDLNPDTLIAGQPLRGTRQELKEGQIRPWKRSQVISASLKMAPPTTTLVPMRSHYVETFPNPTLQKLSLLESKQVEGAGQILLSNSITTNA